MVSRPMHLAVVACHQQDVQNRGELVGCITQSDETPPNQGAPTHFTGGLKVRWGRPNIISTSVMMLVAMRQPAWRN